MRTTGGLTAARTVGQVLAMPACLPRTDDIISSGDLPGRCAESLLGSFHSSTVRIAGPSDT